MAGEGRAPAYRPDRQRLHVPAAAGVSAAVSARVAHLYANQGTRAVWEVELAPSNDWYVYTDPDIVPIEECPLDLVSHLKDWLEAPADFPKAGPGLYLNDLPEDWPHR